MRHQHSRHPVRLRQDARRQPALFPWPFLPSSSHACRTCNQRSGPPQRHSSFDPFDDRHFEPLALSRSHATSLSRHSRGHVTLEVTRHVYWYMVHGTPMVHVYMVHGTPMVLDNERARVLGSAQLVVHKAAAPHAAAAFGILIKEARRAHEQYHLERLDEG